MHVNGCAAPCGRAHYSYAGCQKIDSGKLAEMTGYEPLTNSRFEPGAYGLSLEALNSIAQTLGSKLAAFFDQQDSEEFPLETLRHRITDHLCARENVSTTRNIFRSLKEIDPRMVGIRFLPNFMRQLCHYRNTLLFW